MLKSIRVFIGGNEYSLKSEDEGIVNQAAYDVDEQIVALKKKHLNVPDLTLAVLAALNVSEDKIRYKRQIDEDQRFLVTEFNKMTEFLNENVLKSSTV